jgi:hypothetical protein
MFGFCWGGRISVKSGQVYSEDVRAVGLVHPGGVLTEDALTLNAPALLLPAGDDPDMVKATYQSMEYCSCNLMYPPLTQVKILILQNSISKAILNFILNVKLFLIT